MNGETPIERGLGNGYTNSTTNKNTPSGGRSLARQYLLPHAQEAVMANPHTVSTGRRVRRWHVLGLFALLLAALMPALAGAQAPVKAQPGKEKYKLTLTERGKQLATEAAVRWEKNLKHKVKVDQLEVYDFGSKGQSDIFVIPKDVNFTVTEQLNGPPIVEVQTASTPQVGTSTEPNSIGIMGSSWAWRAGHCLERLNQNGSWIDHCYQVYKLEGDVDGSRDFYQLDRYATAGDALGTTLDGATISSHRSTSNSSTMGWMDWTPRGDIDLPNCSDLTLSVSVEGIGFSKTYLRCERWNITKFAEAGRFSNSWEGSVNDTQREIAYMTSVSVPQGGWPVWIIPASVR